MSGITSAIISLSVSPATGCREVSELPVESATRRPRLRDSVGGGHWVKGQSSESYRGGRRGDGVRSLYENG